MAQNITINDTNKKIHMYVSKQTGAMRHVGTFWSLQSKLFKNLQIFNVWISVNVDTASWKHEQIRIF